METVNKKEFAYKVAEPCIIPDRRKVKFYPSETLTENVENE